MDIERTEIAQRDFNSRLPGEDWDKFMEHQTGQHDPNGASMDTPQTPNFPLRLAAEMQEHVVRQAEMEDHDVGLQQRDDWATEYTIHLIDQNAVNPDFIAWQGLQVWRMTYGRQ